MINERSCIIHTYAFAVDGIPAARGILIEENGQADGNVLRMGRLTQIEAPLPRRAAATLDGHEGMEVLFVGGRFLLGRKAKAETREKSWLSRVLAL